MSESWFNMPKLLLIILMFAFNSFDGYSQKNDIDSADLQESGTYYTAPKPSCARTNNFVKAEYALIKLKTHPLIGLNKDQYLYYSKLLDTIYVLNNVVITDSGSITLKSGISWNLEKGPPPEPKHFIRKALTKKRREDKAVMDRLKYLQFCNCEIEQDKALIDMIDNFTRYFAIIIDKVNISLLIF